MTSLQTARLSQIRFRYLFLGAVIFGGSFVMLTLSRGPALVSLTDDPTRSKHFYYLHADTRFTINTNGCTIPALQPLDDSIRKFIEPPRHLKPCRHMFSSLLSSNATHIWIDNNNIHYYNYNVSQDSNISCCYKAFYRPNAISDITSVYIDDRVKYHDCIEFSDVIEALDEFVKVTCYAYVDDVKITVFEDFFLFALKKPLSSDVPKSNNHSASAYNVIVLGIDSVSRLNFYRTMPKTLSFLKKKGAVELFGYNKIGDNTFPNLAAMLLGVKDTELKRMCWPSPKRTFDNCPFLWNWYRENGFYTALGEDSAQLGTFNFVRSGFASTPTDYYLHTFTNEAEKHAGNVKDFNAFICMGHKYAFKVLLDYVENLARTLQTSKLFGFFWEVTMTHDFLNNPKAMDKYYEKFLRNLDKLNYLDNTILVVLSDHGLRWGNFRSTKQGRLEERLPLVHILLPPAFQETYNSAYVNLKLNSRRLTTPFDIYATLSDLASLQSIGNDMISVRSKQAFADNRSISLFLPIPGNRTCKTAGIDDHWCTCHTDHQLPIDSFEVKHAANFVVESMNAQLKWYPQCARLALAEIVDVREMEAGTPAQDEQGWRELMLLVRAAPGGGVFEATLRGTGGRDEAAPPEWTLAGSVSRINLYGEQSRCVDDYVLKLYCVCKEFAS